MQPLNGSSTITIGTSSSTQSRIEIPSCCNYLGDIEIGYQMSLSDSVATTNMVYLPSTYIPEVQRIEIYPADSTNKWVDLQNANVYSRMSSSLFNDYKKRTVSQRCNFVRDKASNKLIQDFGLSISSAIGGQFMFNTSYTGANNISINGSNVNIAGQQQDINGNYITTVNQTDSSHSDAYFNDSISRGNSVNAMVPTTEFNQQEYLPMGYFSTGAADNTTVTLYPIRYNFNYKLKDFLHDSILSNLKCLYHRSNLVIIIYWQPVSQILFQVPTAVASAQNGKITTSATKNGAPASYSLAPTLNISNLFVRYYAEMNPQICEEIKNTTYEIAYPFLYQANLNLSPGPNGQLGVNLIVGNEGESRIYRVYCGLQGMIGTFLPVDNFTNIQYKKWSGNFELYFNNDLYERLTAAYGDWDATMKAFVDGSINSTVELQNLGTVAYHFDSDNSNGKVNEYDDNVLKGKYCDQFININPRWLSVQNDGGTNPNCNYTGFVFAVIMRKGIMDKGEFRLV